MASRYSLKPYQSVYRDQQGVAINSLLRQRFEQAFASDDAIGGAVDNMESTNFEGDLALKGDLANRTREELRGRAERADYETMGMSSMQSARSFAKGYKPIEQNLASLTAYQKKLQASYDAGDITAETLAGRMAQSTYNYTGLQTDENGEVIEDSFFRGKSFVKDKDFSAAMSEAMKDHAMDKGGTKTRQVGMSIEGRVGEYEILIGNKWERVSHEDVQTIFMDVLADPDMQASLSQQAQLRTFSMTDEDIQMNLLTNLDGDVEDPENTGGLRGELQRAIQEGDEKGAEEAQALIDQAETMLQGDGSETEEEMVERRRQFVEQEFKNQEIQRELGTAYSKYVVDNQWTEYEEDYDAKWLVSFRHEIESYLPEVMIDSGVTQINNPGGATQDDIASYLDVGQGREDAILSTITDQIGLGANGLELTADDIVNGTNIPSTVNPELLRKYSSQIGALREEIYFQEERLADAFTASGQTPEARAAALRNVEGGPELLQVVADLFPGSSEEVQWRMLESYMSGDMFGTNISHAMEESGFTDDGRFKLSWKDFHRLGKGADGIQGFGATFHPFFSGGVWDLLGSKKDLSTREFADRNVDDIMRDMTGTRTASDRKINAELDKTKFLIAGDMVGTNAPGATNAESLANTKAMNAAFVGNFLPENFKIFYDGQVQETSDGQGVGTRQSLMEDAGFEDTPKVTAVRYPKTTIGGLQVLQFTVQGKDSDDNIISKDILVPLSNLEQSGLNLMMEDPIYRMEQELDKHRVHGRPGATIEFINENGVVTGALEYQFETGGKSSGGVVNVLDSEGAIVTTLSMGSGGVASAIRQAHAQNQTFRTRLPQ